MEGIFQYFSEPYEVINFGQDFSGKMTEFIKTRQKFFAIDLWLVSFKFEWYSEGKKTDQGLYCEPYHGRPYFDGLANAHHHPFRETNEGAISKENFDEMMKQVTE